MASTQQESNAFLMSMNAAKVCSLRRRRKEYETKNLGITPVEATLGVGRNSSMEMEMDSLETVKAHEAREMGR